MFKFLLPTLFLLVAKPAAAYDLEYGLGIISLNAPSYRGASSSTNIVLPFPYLKLKTKILKIDRGGIKAKLFNFKKLSFNLSVAGSAPANAKTAIARKDMPKLDFALEIGPSLVYVLHESTGGLFQFEMPIRSVITTDLKNTQHLGYNFNPTFFYQRDIANVKTSFKLGRIYSSATVNDYYYSVDNQFVTPTRSFYKAQEGLSSDMFSFTSSVKFKKHHWVAMQFRYDDLSNSVNRDSPLVKTLSNIQLAFMYAYII